MRTGRGEAVVAGLGRTEREFSERDRDVLDLVRPGLEGALRAAQARGRLVRALAADPPPGTAVVLLDRDGEIELSSADAERWLAEHFGAAEHPGWLPAPVAEWLALPPRPPLVSERDGRRLTVRLLPGDPHALLLEEEVASFRADALDRLGLTPRETEVLRAAAVDRGRGRDRLGAVPQPARRPRAARAPRGQARRAHGRGRRRPGAPRERVDTGRRRGRGNAQAAGRSGGAAASARRRRAAAPSGESLEPPEFALGGCAPAVEPRPIELEVLATGARFVTQPLSLFALVALCVHVVEASVMRSCFSSPAVRRVLFVCGRIDRIDSRGARPSVSCAILSGIACRGHEVRLLLACRGGRGGGVRISDGSRCCGVRAGQHSDVPRLSRVRRPRQRLVAPQPAQPVEHDRVACGVLVGSHGRPQLDLRELRKLRDDLACHRAGR